MKKILMALVVFFVIAASAFSQTNNDYGRSRIQEMSWDGIDVVWLQDDRFPTYSIRIYFADGALSDGENSSGLVDTTFDLLSSGTSRLDSKEIADYFEYHAISFGSSVFHEQTSFTMSGIIKDLNMGMEKICHLFKEASFPESELENYKKRAYHGFQSLVNSHQDLADRAFREIVMAGTPFQYPSSGKQADLENITREKLKQTLDHFNGKVKKRIYLYGPKEVLSIKDIVLNQCGWNSQASFVRVANHEKVFPNTGKPSIHLVTVPQANQAKIMVGRYLNKSELKNDKPGIHRLMGSILGGGGFNSLLMQELRVKRGWVYSAYAYSASQRDYGRASIIAETRNEQVVPLLQETRKILQTLFDAQIPSKQFEVFKTSLMKKHPFSFEAEGSYLSQLASMDHLGRDYARLYLFPENIRSHSIEDVAEVAQRVFAWEKQTIMVLGSADLKEALEALGTVTVTDYEEFL